jgi:hypothetical protein
MKSVNIKTLCILIASIICVLSLKALPQIVTPLHQSTDIAYSDGEYVAVTENGSSYFSFDGVEWNTLPTATNEPLYSVVPFQGAWLASGSEGTLLIRRDGEYIWDAINPYSLTGEVKLVVGTDTIIAYSNNGLWLSTNGEQWSKISGIIPYPEHFPLAWVNDRFILQAKDGSILESTDGVQWTPASPSIEAFHSMAYYDGHYYISNLRGILRSPDGSNWTIDKEYTYFPDYNRLVATSMGLLHLRGYEASIRTEEGEWGELVVPEINYLSGKSKVPDFAKAVTSDGSEFLIVGEFGYTAWKDQLAPEEIIYEVYFPGKEIIDEETGETIIIDTRIDGNEVVVDAGKLKYSPIRSGPIPYDFVEVSYGNDRFVALPSGDADVVYVSSDGVLWQGVLHTGIELDDAEGPLTFGASKFLLPSKTGGLYSSTNGYDWEYKNTLGHIEALVYGEGKFIASARSSESDVYKFYYSFDGTIWIGANAPYGGSNGALVWNNGVFVGGSNTAFGLHYSLDGINWDFITPNAGLMWPEMHILTSTTPITRPVQEWPTIKDIGVAADRFLITYGSKIYDPYISADGKNWSWIDDEFEKAQFGGSPTETSAPDIPTSSYFLKYHNSRQGKYKEANVIAGLPVTGDEIDYYYLGEYFDAAATSNLFVAVGSHGRIAASTQDRPTEVVEGPLPKQIPNPPTGVPPTPPPEFIPDGLEEAFPNAIYLNNTWWTESGFGAFSDQSWPWISHPQHGWQYVKAVDSSGTSGRYIYDMGLEWLWSSGSVPQWFYKFSDGSWYYYYAGSESPRWFYNISSEQFLPIY